MYHLKTNNISVSYDYGYNSNKVEAVSLRVFCTKFTEKHRTACNFINKDTLRQVISCELQKTFYDSYSLEYM